MATTPTTHELICKYLDRVATDADVAELMRRVREDPAAADIFARACRHDAWLSRRFREQKNGEQFKTALEEAGRKGQQLRRGRRRIAWATATAAAALLCLALLLLPAPGEPEGCAVLAGSVADASGRIVKTIDPGRNHIAGADTVVRADERTMFMVTADTEFAVGTATSEAPPTVSVPSGALLAQVETGEGGLTVTLDGVEVRSSGGEFFGWCNAPWSASGGWGLLRGAFADGMSEVYLHAFTGDLRICVGGRDRVLAQGESCLISDGLRVRTRSELEAETRRLPRQGLGDVARMRDRLLVLRRYYARRLPELEDRSRPVEYRAERIAVVKRLLEAHTRALERLKHREADVLARETAIEDLARMTELEGEAEAARRKLLELLSSAP